MEEHTIIQRSGIIHLAHPSRVCAGPKDRTSTARAAVEERGLDSRSELCHQQPSVNDRQGQRKFINPSRRGSLVTTLKQRVGVYRERRLINQRRFLVAK